MANLSITASNTNAPFDDYLLSDASFTLGAPLSASGVTSPILNFKVPNPWPLVNATELYVYSTVLTGATGSVSLYVQDSADGVTWANVVGLAAPILSPTASNAVNNYFTLQPNIRQYLRVSCSVAAGNGIPTGSVGATILF